jgi:hypothetical protein
MSTKKVITPSELRRSILPSFAKNASMAGISTNSRSAEIGSIAKGVSPAARKGLF